MSACDCGEKIKRFSVVWAEKLGFRYNLHINAVRLTENRANDKPDTHD